VPLFVWRREVIELDDRIAVLPLQWHPFSVRMCHDRFHCEQCGACCRYDKVPVRPHDIKRAPEIRPYLSEDGKHLVTKGGCPFLKDNRCSIYDRRPDTCWLFPLQSPVKGTFEGKEIELVAVRLRCKAALNVVRLVLSESAGKLELSQDLTLRRLVSDSTGKQSTEAAGNSSPDR